MTTELHLLQSAAKPWLHRAWFKLTDATREDDGASDFQLLYTAAPSYVLIAAAHRHGNIVIDGLLYPLQPDTVHVIEPGQRVELNYPAAGEQSVNVFAFAVFLPWLEEETDMPQGLPEFSRGTVSSAAELHALCQKIWEGWQSGDVAGMFASQAGFHEILHLLVKKPDQHEDALDRARTHMHEHFQQEITVEQLAETAGMSRFHFMRSFKERFGQSVMDCLTELRTIQAKQLMEAGGQTLREIAEQVGYKDPLYFSSQFKKHVGISPKIYMANRTCKVAAYSWPNIGQLLALQVIPHAAPIDQAWTDDYRKKYRFDVKVPLSHDYDFNREALIRAQPDRIVALAELVPEEERVRLQEIAPVLFLPWVRESWREHLRLTAQFLQREKEGEKWLSRYDEQAGAIRQKLPSAFTRGSLLIVTISARGIKAWGRRAGTVLYDDLQVECAESVEQIRFTEEIGAERLAEMRADRLLVNVLQDRKSQLYWETLRNSESWQRVQAVRDQHVYFTSGHARFSEPILEYTAYSHLHFLQELDMLFRAL